MFINPLLIYALSFLLVFITYSFEWSEFYPKLSFELGLFLFFSIIISIIFGIFINKVINSQYLNISIRLKSYKLIIFFIYLCFVLEIWYSGGVPIVGIIIQDTMVNYMEFGIPTFHVFFIILKGSYELLLYYSYILQNEKKYLYGFLILGLIDVFIVNRANVLFTLISVTVIFLDLRKKSVINMKLLSYIVIITIFVLYLFGVMGNYRSSVAFGNEYNNDFIYNIGQASNVFRESIIPGEFFWAYLYISSPLANLQHTVSSVQLSDIDYLCDINSIVATLGYGGLPDFISKRFMPLLGYSSPISELLEENLNVCTMYNSSFYLAGYIGVILHYFIFLFMTSGFLLISYNTRYASIIKGCLCAISVFTVFVNSIAFIGWIGQVWFFVILSKTNFLRGWLYE